MHSTTPGRKLLFSAFLLLSAGAPQSGSNAGEPGPLPKTAETIRYREGVYFRVEVPETVRARAVPFPGSGRGMACVVKTGPAADVFLLTSAAIAHAGSHSDGWTEAREQEYQRLNREQAAIRRELNQHQSRLRTCQQLSKDKELSEAARDEIAKQLAPTQTKVDEASKRYQAVQKEMSKLNKIRYSAHRAVGPRGNGLQLVGRARSAGTVAVALPALVSFVSSGSLSGDAAGPGSGISRSCRSRSSAAFCFSRCVPSAPYFLISTLILSDGLAPTPSQYWIRSPRRIARASTSGTIGSYVPSSSRTLPSRVFR